MGGNEFENVFPSADGTLTAPYEANSFDNWVSASLTVSLANPSPWVKSAISGAMLTAVPEPSSAALHGLGSLALILSRRK
ncbi:MAG TPA: hypothetical protein DEP88_07045 [Verrucomicrobiales bacterium]|nr:hypothetical protein [Verrucomicrobiales bacterium]HCI92649.1 hypothetical protein [Verrucomicrobiales bacterium]HCL96455.1 hypothetical protein [Verrucomicrobiales bacterium]